MTSDDFVLEAQLPDVPIHPDAPIRPRRKVHLVSNAHLDPVWLWEWEEGAAAAISTFRTAADLCEAFEGFVFNHNEAILYRWVEEYEPALFERIRRLVREGKWHIMGGWYLQPDCNMPSGESFVRQILLGRRYFAEKFDVAPTTAINFDPFGHTRGLVQILAKSGYDSYLFCRPGQEDCQLQGDEFLWEGHDGSRIMAHRVFGFYNSPLGKAREKVESCLMDGPKNPSVIILWGVGDHGGGPSQKDLSDLAELILSRQDEEIIHSTPEAYFADLKNNSFDKIQVGSLPVHRKDLNPWAVGCYTSMIRVKQRHRLLENELFATEKMACAAWVRGLLEGSNRPLYPQNELGEAMRDLATCQFHDILPGSSIQPAEEMALRTLDHGLEIISRVKARAFFALAQNQSRAKDGEIPILVYNPHPYSLRRTIECEFQLPDFNLGGTFTQVTVYQGVHPLPTQVEKEISNIALDWRKRVVFTADLAPAQMNRFDCRLTGIPHEFTTLYSTPSLKPAPELKATDGIIRFTSEELEVLINTNTGLLDQYRVHGVDYLDRNACYPLVMLDSPDPWGMQVRRFHNTLGAFAPLSQQDNLRFSGVLNPSLPSVRVIEDGFVRSVIEAVLGYGDSTVVLRYKLPKHGTEIEVEIRVYWNEKDRMLKLSLPVPDKTSSYFGQVAYGVDRLPENGDEAVAQKWVAVVSKARDTALTVINDGIYGSDFSYGELRLSLLRSPAYSGHPIGQQPIVPQDRFSPRIDQGERLFRFWINGGPAEARLQAVDREALTHNEKPMALSFFPVGGVQSQGPFVTLDDEAVQITALKMAEDGNGLIMRLFNPTNQERTVNVSLPLMNLENEVTLRGYELRTFLVNRMYSLYPAPVVPNAFATAGGGWVEVNLVEQPL